MAILSYFEQPRGIFSDLKGLKAETSGLSQTVLLVQDGAKRELALVQLHFPVRLVNSPDCESRHRGPS